MITDPRSSLTENKSNPKESSFPAELPLIKKKKKILGRLICSRPRQLENFRLSAPGTPD